MFLRNKTMKIKVRNFTAQHCIWQKHWIPSSRNKGSARILLKLDKNYTLHLYRHKTKYKCIWNVIWPLDITCFEAISPTLWCTIIKIQPAVCVWTLADLFLSFDMHIFFIFVLISWQQNTRYEAKSLFQKYFKYLIYHFFSCWCWNICIHTFCLSLSQWWYS